MMDKAIAQYRIEAEAVINALPPTTRAQYDRDKAVLDAAVRDVALAAALAGWDCNCDVALDELKAEINRQFGLPEGSEGGKE